MNNVTIISGWLGTSVADLARRGGPATVSARPRYGQLAIFGVGQTRPTGVPHLA